MTCTVSAGVLATVLALLTIGRAQAQGAFPENLRYGTSGPGSSGLDVMGARRPFLPANVEPNWNFAIVNDLEGTVRVDIETPERQTLHLNLASGKHYVAKMSPGNYEVVVFGKFPIVPGAGDLFFSVNLSADPNDRRTTYQYRIVRYMDAFFFDRSRR